MYRNRGGYGGGWRKRSRHSGYGSSDYGGRKRHVYWQDAPYHWQRGYWQASHDHMATAPTPPPAAPPPPRRLEDDPNFEPPWTTFTVTNPPEHEPPDVTHVNCENLATSNGGSPLSGVDWQFQQFLATGLNEWISKARQHQTLEDLTVHRGLTSTAVPIAIYYSTQSAYDQLDNVYFNLDTDLHLDGFHPYTYGYEKDPSDATLMSLYDAAIEYGNYTPTGQQWAFFLHWYSKPEETPLDAWERVVHSTEYGTPPAGKGLTNTVYWIVAKNDTTAEDLEFSGFGSAPLADTLPEGDPFKGGHSNVLFVATPPNLVQNPWVSPFDPPVDDAIHHYNYAGFACDANALPTLPSGQELASYLSNDVNVTSGTPVADPNDWNPDTRGCNEYVSASWPLSCPQQLTWDWYQDIMAPVLAEMNGYRTANGLEPLALDYGLTVLAFAHATYFTENWEGYLEASPTHGSKAHLEPPAGPTWEFDPAMPDGWGDPWNPAIPEENVVNVWSRARYFGFEHPTQVAEGISNTGGKTTPMQLFCAQMDSLGHRKPYVEQGQFLYVGFGFDYYEAALGNRTQGVFNYSPFPTTMDPVSGKDLYEWFPKFACAEAPTLGEFPWGDGTDPTYDYNDSGWLTNKAATALFTGYETATPIPDVSGCANYDANEYWPLGCVFPRQRTLSNYEQAFQQCLDFGNWFRANLPAPDGPLGPLVWSNAVALAAQAHATFVCEHYNEYYADGMRGWYTGPAGGAIHYEPPQGFGYTQSNRIKYFGGDNIGASGEGVGETNQGNHNPMNFFCAQKSDWVSIDNAGHFGAFYSRDTVYITCNYVGIGYDWDPVNNRMLWVIDYCVSQPQEFAGGDIPQVLPKFACGA